MIDELFREPRHGSASSARSPQKAGAEIPPGRMSPEETHNGHVPDRAQRRADRINRTRFDTPEEVDHAKEAEELKDALTDVLADHKTGPKMVAPTRDYEGHVRLDFRAAWALVDMADELAELKAKEANRT